MLIVIVRTYRAVPDSVTFRSWKNRVPNRHRFQPLVSPFSTNSTDIGGSQPKNKVDFFKSYRDGRMRRLSYRPRIMSLIFVLLVLFRHRKRILVFSTEMYSYLILVYCVLYKRLRVNYVSSVLDLGKK